MKLLRGLVVTGLLPVALGCAPSTGEDDDSSAGPMPANAARSASCLAWQDAMCDYLADTCQSVARSQCDEELRSLFCKSDDTMETCVDALATGTCPDTPDDCEGVADTAPAKWYCETFVETLCARGEACNLSSKVECIKDADESLNCDLAVGAGTTVDTCLSKLGSVSCSALGAHQLPAECQAVIKMVQTASLKTSEDAWFRPTLYSAQHPIRVDVRQNIGMRSTGGR